jgi:serine/threonine protein kinase
MNNITLNIKLKDPKTDIPDTIQTPNNIYTFDYDITKTVMVYSDKDYNKYVVKTYDIYFENKDEISKEIIINKLLTFGFCKTKLNLIDQLSQDQINQDQSTIYLNKDQLISPLSISDFVEYIYEPTYSVIKIITKYVGIDIFYYLESNPTFYLNEDDTKHIFKQMLIQVYNLHQMKISHTDISCENICLDDFDSTNPKVVLIDFGNSLISPKSNYYNLIEHISQSEYIDIINTSDDDIICKFKDKFFKSSESTKPYRENPIPVGKPLYISPERLLAQYDSTKCFSAYKDDIYSMGIVLFVLLTGRTPYSENIKLSFLLKNLESGYIIDNYIQNNMLNVSNECINLLKKLICLENKRISLNEILQHEWLLPVMKNAS